MLTADTPFGIATNFSDFRESKRSKEIELFLVKGGKRSTGFIPRNIVKKNSHLIYKWKVPAPKAGSDAGRKIPDSVLGKPWLCPPSAVCTQTYLAFFVDTEEEANSVLSYYKTRFFRHLVSLRKKTQDALRPIYSWVPQQTCDRIWTDEIDFIESMIRPMEPNDE
jgi:site-specific DNA-methyltransferase (adenine-specific)